MTIVVPFDNSELSRIGLQRATELRRSPEEIIAVTVIPNDNAEYASERGWLDGKEEFDAETVVSTLETAVKEISPSAAHDYVVTGRYANAGQIASDIRSYARDADARTVVIGSENAGRITSTVGSIGRSVSTDRAYDVYIVRTRPNQ